MEDWKNKFKETFIVIDPASFPDLELIIEILIFEHHRSSCNPSLDEEFDSMMNAVADLIKTTGGIKQPSKETATISNEEQPEDHQQEEEIDLFDSEMNAVADIINTTGGIKLVRKSSSPTSETARYRPTKGNGGLA